ncbi:MULTISPECIES: nuclease-related domain-containing protein [unclassified Bradyrhizobium]|uniref:nuclease-related domain-containing protein n=1 Tax=unclassified Bradyrhizobium TaxID=2631580 RepID=UPI002916564B|nr:MULTISPECIES: nuclease-related domain-containing protein [unclassified Bradyrhizobium]
MAFHFSAGDPESNERDAIERLCGLFGDAWVLVTSLPQYFAGREIDAVLLGPKGMIVLELKNHSGEIFCPALGDWQGIREGGNPLSQAGKCAQKLKTRLTEKDEALKRLYIDYAVLMTNTSCVLRVHPDLEPFRVDKLENVVALVNGRFTTEPRNRPIDRQLGIRTFEIIAGEKLPESVLRCWSANERKARPATYEEDKLRAPRDKNRPPDVPPSIARPRGPGTSGRKGIDPTVRPSVGFRDKWGLALILLAAVLIYEVYSGVIQLFDPSIEQNNIAASNVRVSPPPEATASLPSPTKTAPREPPAPPPEVPPISSGTPPPAQQTEPNANGDARGPSVTQTPKVPLPPRIRSIVLNRADKHGLPLNKLPDLVQQRTQIVATVSYENSSDANKIALVLKPAHADWEWPCAPESAKTPKGVVSCWWNEALESDRYTVIVSANGQVLSQKEFQVMVPPAGAPVDVSPDRRAIQPPDSMLVKLQLAVSDFAIHPSATYVGENSVLSFTVRNVGTSHMGIALKDRSFSAGPCMPRGWNPATAGIAAVDADAGTDVIDRSLTALAPSQSISGTISIASPDCNLTMLSGLQAVPVTLNFLVLEGDRRRTVSLTVERVRVRPLSTHYTGGSYFGGDDN